MKRLTVMIPFIDQPRLVAAIAGVDATLAGKKQEDELAVRAVDIVGACFRSTCI